MPNLPVPAAPRTSLSLAATLAALAFAPFVDGAVVLSNHSSFSPTGSSFYVNGTNAGEAIRVTTGTASGWSLNSVSILVNYVSDSAVFQIWTDAGGTLGSLVATSASVSTTIPFGNVTFNFTSPVSLAGSTSYWFTAKANPGNSSSVEWWNEPNATPSLSAAGWLQGSQLSTSNFTTWSASSNRSYASLEIDATAASSSGVPDGTSTAFMLLPGAGLLALSFRRRTAGA